MKNLSFSLRLFLCLGIMLTSCKREEPKPEVFTIEANDFGVGLYNGVQNGAVVGTVSATTNGGTLTYAIASQGVASALAINASTGQITVTNRDAIYAFRCSPPYPMQFTVTITISNGSTTKNITLTVGVSSLGCA